MSDEVRAPEEAPRRGHRVRWWRIGLGVALLFILGVSIFFCVGSPGYYSSKLSAVGMPAPRRTPGPVVALTQTEPHTCGYCSMAAIYRAYGLDPEELRLRFRLGTDKPVSNFLPETQGTIHPDMLRVLSQDGFDASVVAPSSGTALPRLYDCLDAGQCALVLTKVKDFHWVVASGRHGDAITIHDSLHPLPYEKDGPAYLQNEVYSLLLLRPRYVPR